MQNDQSYVERYCLGLLVGEIGEALCHIGNALRFGYNTPETLTDSSRKLLNGELGDIMAAIEFSSRHHLVSIEAIEWMKNKKLAKLLNASNKDNLGRPLAPQPE